MRHAIAEPCKTGWVYELDRTTGAPLIGINEVKVPQDKAQNTWPTQPKPVGDPFSKQCANKKTYTGKFANIGGHPVKVGCIFTPYDTTHAAAFGPSAQGGNDWNSPSYNPATHYMYVCAADSDFSLLGVPAAKLASSYLAGQGFFGVTFGTIKFYRGFVTAMDMTDNKIAWTHVYHSPCYSGSFTSAGNVVFAGQVNGEYDAFDATTGQQLWSTQARRGCRRAGHDLQRQRPAVRGHLRGWSDLLVRGDRAGYVPARRQRLRVQAAVLVGKVSWPPPAIRRRRGLLSRYHFRLLRVVAKDRRGPCPVAGESLSRS